MQAERKVVPVHVAQELKRLGFSHETERFWYQYVGDFTEDMENGRPAIKSGDWELRDANLWGNGVGEHLPAPDAQEIDLPAMIESSTLRYYLIIDRAINGSWAVLYKTYTTSGASLVPLFAGQNEAQARAEVWIFLRDNKLI